MGRSMDAVIELYQGYARALVRQDLHGQSGVAR
jgi:hypothetical protein